LAFSITVFTMTTCRAGSALTSRTNRPSLLIRYLRYFFTSSPLARISTRSACLNSRSMARICHEVIKRYIVGYSFRILARKLSLVQLLSGHSSRALITIKTFEIQRTSDCSNLDNSSRVGRVCFLL
jgi:hypothetical protein